MALRDLVFWIVAIVTVGCALSVVFNRNIFRAALFLIVAFFSIAILYVLLAADFLAAVQVLIYVGAIGVLIIFAVMLTREIHRGNVSNKLSWVAFITSLFLFALISFSLMSTRWKVVALPAPVPTTEGIGMRLFTAGGFVLPFEIASALLLAAIIGAIVLVREK